MSLENASLSTSLNELDLAPKTRLLLGAPVMPTLMRLSAPNLFEAAARITFLTADAIFVSRLGNAAIAAVAIVYPLLLIVQTLTASGFGAGVASSIGHALGAGDRKRASGLAEASMLLALVGGAATAILALSGGPAFYRLTGTTSEVASMASVYSNTLFAGIGFVWSMNLLANVSRGAGNTVVSASAIVVGEICHLLLSPALIAGWGPFPRLGIGGAAIGALSAYVVGTFVLTAHLLSKRALARINIGSIWSSYASIAPILRIGTPAAFGILVFGSMNLVALQLLGQFSTENIAAFGLASRVDVLLYPLTFAFGSSLMTMMATAAGYGDYRRAANVAWTGCAIGGLIGLTFTGIGLLGQHWMLLFTKDPAIVGIGAQYLRIQASVYPLFAAGASAISACYAIGLARVPLFINSARLIWVLLGGWVVLRTQGTATGIFLVMAGSSVLYGLCVLGLLRSKLNKLTKA